MSYDRWDRPWSDRENYSPPPRPRTRVVREIRARDFFFGVAILVFLMLATIGLTIDGVNVWVDVLRHGQKSRFGVQDVNWATWKIVLSPLATILFAWLFGRMVKGWWWALTAPADTLYIKRRY